MGVLRKGEFKNTIRNYRIRQNYVDSVENAARQSPYLAYPNQYENKIRYKLCYVL